MTDQESPAQRSDPTLTAAVADALVAAERARTAILVEGWSDQAALEVLAVRRGRDLDAEGVAIVPIGGYTNLGHFLTLLGRDGLGLDLAGLCDANEEGHFRLVLERAGIGTALTRNAMASLGFYVCDADLEDELIRALGPVAVQRVIEEQGDLGSLNIFRRQPAQRDRTDVQHLRRFMGTRSGRKINYARFLVQALDLDRVPPPLDAVLAHVNRSSSPPGL